MSGGGHRRCLQEEARGRRREATHALERGLADRERGDRGVESDASRVFVDAAHGDVADDVVDAEASEHRGHDPRAGMLDKRALAEEIERVMLVRLTVGRARRGQHLDAGESERPLGRRGASVIDGLRRPGLSPRPVGAPHGRERYALHRGVSSGRCEALVERLREAGDLALAQTAWAAVLARPKGLDATCLVLSAELPESLRRHVERLGEPAEVTPRIRGQLDQDGVTLELLALLVGADERPADEDLGRRAAYDNASPRREPVRDGEAAGTRELERLRRRHDARKDRTFADDLKELYALCNLRTGVTPRSPENPQPV